MKAAAFALLLVLALLAAPALADFEARCELIHNSVDKRFNCTMYQQTDGDEYLLRINICYVEDGANSLCESIIQRFDRTVGAGYKISSQMILGEPWTSWRTCCQHDALGSETPRPALAGVVGETFPVVRSDNFTLINITSVSATVPSNLNALITDHWDDAEEKCKLQCSTEADVVFNIDTSSSINGEEFLGMVAFMEAFMDAFTISASKTNLAFVTFSGNSCRDKDNKLPDRFWMPESVCSWNSAAAAETAFDNAIVSPAAFVDSCNWTFGTTDPGTYVSWEMDAGEGNSDRDGYAYLELAFTHDRGEINDLMTKLGDGTARWGIYDACHQHTSIGTGISLSWQMFYRNPNRPVSAAGESNGFDRLLITLADGGVNRGENVADAATRAKLVPNITLIGVAIGNGVNYAEMLAAAGGDSDNLYEALDFTEASFNAILAPLISGACTGKSDNSVPCSADCAAANGLCTSCGDCIQCTLDSDCPSCAFCSASPFGTCVSDTASSVSLCSADNLCQKVVCNSSLPRDQMCQATDNDPDATAAAESDCLGSDPDKFSFDAETCICTTLAGDGDGSVAAGAIAGGAVAASIALLLLLLALLALALVVLAVAVFIIIAIVLAAIVMLAFGVSMAIPPSITALEVTAPNQVVNEENPLAVDQMEWVESAAQND